MHIPVLIESVGDSGFRARSGEPLPLTAEGATREEALNNLRQVLEHRLKAGAELTSLDIGPKEHPLAEFAGMLKDNPLFDRWKAAIAEYRRQVDEDEDIP